MLDGKKNIPDVTEPVDISGMLEPEEDPIIELERTIEEQKSVEIEEISESRINEAISNLQEEIAKLNDKLNIWLERKNKVEQIQPVRMKRSELGDVKNIKFRFLDKGK